MRKYVLLSLSIIWTFVILSFSVQSGETSGSLSYQITLNVYYFLKNLFINLDVDTLHLVIRKCAHIGEYAILGILYSLTARQFHIKTVIIIFCGLAVAFIDEGIQLLSINRGPSIIDTLLFDFPGFLLGFYMMLFIHKKIYKI